MIRPELFDAVAVGGTLSTRARFSVRILHGRFEIPPRTVLVVTHRSDWDIPLTTNIYWGGRLWHGVKPIFVARDDMFRRGFLAGYPPGLPLPLRRALAPVDVGGALRAHRLALPITSATTAHLVDVVRDQPSVPLAELPADATEALRARARRLGLPEPRIGADVDRPGFLDLLWQRRTREELPGLDAFWARRAAVARRQLERLLEHVARGGALLVYPEGLPSSDGAIGPVQRGLGLLVRRAEPERLLPVALAYDPLGARRTRAYVVVGEPFAPAGRRTEQVVLERLKALMPATPGQVAAHALLHGADPEHVAARAADGGRPAEPRLDELVPAAVAAARQAPRAVLERLDLEFRSARGF